MDRNELAARFAVAAYGDGREWNGTREDLAEYAVAMADALLAELASKGVDPESNDVRCKVADAYMMGVDEGLRVGKKVNSTAAPVEAAPGKYVPKVGDVVTHVEYPGEEFTIQSVDEWGVTTQRTDAGVRYDTEGTCGSADNLRYLRDSTDAEKRAAVLAVPPPAPTPAPEAKRPTHVRVTRLAHNDRPATVGKVYEVVRWNYDGSPDVIGDNGSDLSLSKPDGSDEKVWPAWEPAPCPPPVAGSEVGIPRRIDISRQTPIEAAIRAARAAVEAGPAHPHMTRATTLLGQALDAVADFVDGVPEVRP